MSMGIRDASKQTGLTAHTLRYYERIGLILDVPRDHAGHRVYEDTQISWLVFLSKLRTTGMPIQKMLRYAELVRQGPDTASARTVMLQDHRDTLAERITELQDHLAVIDTKLGNYRQGAYG